MVRFRGLEGGAKEASREMGEKFIEIWQTYKLSCFEVMGILLHLAITAREACIEEKADDEEAY